MSDNRCGHGLACCRETVQSLNVVNRFLLSFSGGAHRGGPGGGGMERVSAEELVEAHLFPSGLGEFLRFGCNFAVVPMNYTRMQKWIQGKRGIDARSRLQIEWRCPANLALSDLRE